ncbi:MAG: T9SS type A sorting domain-containing protein, partial [Chitinophagales bacterium]|nr:T9SS type A sorting domain-containing protein [Chitinophagales bacterium]
IENIPLGTSITVTSSIEAGCETSNTLTGPTDCPVECNFPNLTMGQGICDGGGTWSVSFVETTGAILSTNAGTIIDNTVINIPIGTDLVISANNGNCAISITVLSVADCDNTCENPRISIGGTICTDANQTYSVIFTATVGSTVTSDYGVVGAGVITGIPAGQAVTVTVSFPGCPAQVVVVPAPECSCEDPVLTIGDIVCDGDSYSITYYHSGDDIVASAGVVNGNRIENIPLGTSITVTSSIEAGCETSNTLTGPTDCPVDCDFPNLTMGQGICAGDGFWLVSFVETTGAILSTNVGTIVDNKVINIPIGTDLVISANNGSCAVSITVLSVEDCNRPCENPRISIGGAFCTELNTTYSIIFTLYNGASLTSNYGVIGDGIITGIPSGQDVILTVSFPGCEAEVIHVPAPYCPDLSSLGDFVWHDLDGNGQQDPGEPGIPGVQVNLYRSNGMYMGTQYTDANGKYLFVNLWPRDYYLEFITPDGYDKTFFNRGNDVTDSDNDGTYGPGTTTTIHLGEGVDDLTWDAGYYKCIPIGDLVWYDINKNDIWDTNENGINGLQVNLWRNHFGTWMIWEHTFTGHRPGTPSDDGYWSFCTPPGEYYVEVIMPPLGLVRARPNVGNNRFIDSDITNANGPTTTNKFTVVSGGTKLDIGAGFYPQATAGSLVWLDANGDGVRDNNEEMVEGVKVEAILASTHEVVGTAFTDEDGVYELEELEKQAYYFRFTPPSTFYPTVAAATSDDKDSDVDHSNGLNTTRTFDMQPETSYKNIDMGIMFAPLPLEWLDVTAKRDNEVHVIKWQVGQELYVSHYEVERRLESENDFNVIPGRIDAKGNTRVVDYQHKDYDVSRPGVYLYRVKQYDLNGKFTYSKIVKVVHYGENSIELYPNPAYNETNLIVNLTQDASVAIEIFDGSSRLVKVVSKAELQLAGDKTYKIDLESLSAGVYNVVVTIDGVKTQKKLIRIE